MGDHQFNKSERVRRREFLRATPIAISATGLGMLLTDAAKASLDGLPDPPSQPTTLATDEAYWASVRSLLHVDESQIWLSHGAGGVVPRPVVEHLNHCVTASASGAWEIPEFRDIKESGSSARVRELIAGEFGAQPSEVALTRNTMEALATCLLGFDLRAGDEVVTTSSDYDSCIAILRQREARDGIRLKIVDLATPLMNPQDAVAAIEAAMTARTRLVLVSHMTYGTGQILPVREICAVARRHGALSVVDGAHSVGHFEFRLDELGCDCFAGSLHKWFMGPRGSGFLYVRRDRIKDIWPIFAPYSGKAADDIEKFEECGTVSKAVGAALPIAFAFNQRIGLAAKEARLRRLRQIWSEPLRGHDRVHFWTNLDESQCCGVAAFSIDGLPPAEIVRYLRERHNMRIRTLGNPYLPNVRGVNIGLTLVNSGEHAEQLAQAIGEILRLS